MQWLDRFNKVVETKDGYQCACPAHEDDKASLSINKVGGKWLMCCHAGCRYGDILRAVKLKPNDINPSELKPEKPVKRRIVAEYNYTDETGKLLFQSIRYEPKDFRQRMPDGSGGWSWRLKGCKLVPYNLPAIIAADTVYIVEGEKDAETLIRTGRAATCNPMGAGKWRDSFSEYLKGKTVYIFPDNDEPGKNHAGLVMKSLKQFVASAKIVDIPDGHKDITDYIRAGGNVDDLINKPEPPAEDLRGKYNPYRDTHLGNAERLINAAGDNLRYSDHIGWLTWNKTAWVTGDKAVCEIYKRSVIPQIYQEVAAAALNYDSIGAKILTSWAKKSESAGIMRETIQMASSMEKLQVNGESFDKDAMLFNCLDGTIDLRGGDLLPHKRENYITKTAPVHFNESAKCPRWIKFLEELFPDQPELIDWLQRAVGYCLTGSVSEQVMFFLTGCGRNGKSVFMNTIMALLGQYACETPTETLTAKTGQQQGIANDLARLPSIRLVSANETEYGQRLAEAKIKAMTGGDTITARFLHKEFFDFKPVFKLWLRSNHKPVIKGTDEGIWRRIRLIPFTQNFEGREDRDLQSKLLAELEGILQWALAGCIMWQAKGLEMPNTVAAATQQYRSSQDIIGLFLDETCEKRVYSHVSCKKLYELYSEWCEESGERPLSQRKLNESLTERGFKKQRLGAAYQLTWTNMILLSDKGEIL